MIARGVAPIVAIQISSINAACYAGVDIDMGSIAPGKIADILFVSDIESYVIDEVMANGAIVAKNYKYMAQMSAPKYPDFAYNTVSLPKARMEAADFEIAAPAGKNEVKAKVIGQKNGLLVTEYRTATMTVKDGKVPVDLSQDILKLSRIDRYDTSNKWATAFVQGYGLKCGAMGNTWNGQKEDIFIVGANDEDMAVVANRLAEIGGGFVVARDGKVVSELPLPLFGLLSDRPFDEVVETSLAMNKALKEMGCPFDGPMTQLALMGVPIEIGNLKLSEFGLVDVHAAKVIPVVE